MANVEIKDSGSLQDRSAIARLLDVIKTPFKGVVVFGRAKEKKSFIFDDGKPLFPNSLLSEALLGKILFEKNVMNVDQFKKVKELEASGKTFFQALMSSDVKKQEILQLILEPWHNDLSTVFSWESGQFASVEFLPKDVTKIEIDLPLYHYFFRALIVKNKKVKSKIPSTARFEMNSFDDLGFKPENLMMNDLEKKIFDRLGQPKQIKQISSEIGSTESLVGPIVISLRDIGIVRIDTDPRKKIQSEIPVPTIPLNEEFTSMDEKNLMTKLAKMDELDFYQVLEVDQAVTQQQLQAVYFSLAKKYHPDRLKTKVSIRAKDADKFFAKITEAYNTLSNPVLRKEYELKNSKEAMGQQELMRKIVESEQVYLEGKSFLNKNMFAEAVEKINQAIALYDQEPEYFINLAWATFRQAIKDGKSHQIVDAKKTLVDAYNKEYQMADVSYYLGMISKHEGKLDQAVNYFRKCIGADSNHAMAMSELRLLEKKLEEKPRKKK